MIRYSLRNKTKQELIKCSSFLIICNQYMYCTSEMAQVVSARMCMYPEVTIMINMMTSSNGNIFRVNGHLCGEFTGPRWIPRTKASTRIFDVFFDLRLNKRLSKHPWGWWFETPPWSLWRQCNDTLKPFDAYMRQWSSASSVQVMACRLFGTKSKFWKRRFNGH